MKRNSKEAEQEFVGKVFSRLEVISYYGRDKFNNITYKVKCSCGTLFVTIKQRLKNGRTKSCGCLQRELTGKINYKHGFSGHNKDRKRIYIIWSDLVQRTTNVERERSDCYIGRGITICEDWKDFIKFKDWAMENGYQDHLTLERIDVNKSYYPENCTWIPSHDQAKNTRRSISLKYLGRRYCLKDFCRRVGVSYSNVQYRIKTRKLSLSQAFEDLGFVGSDFICKA